MSNSLNQSPNPPAESSSYSPWQSKPWWCQPWSIVLTGITLIGGSWVLFHRWWMTGLVALPIGTWMVYFVLVWPALMQRYMAEQIDQPERSL